MSHSRDILEKWCSELTVKAHRVLDVGGSQRPINTRVKSWEVDTFMVSDLEKPHETILYPDLIFDLNVPIKLQIDLPDFKFDTIFCLEVMEYIYDPMTAIKNLAFLSRSGTKLYISVHFVYPVHRPSGTDMLRYTDMGMAKLLEMNGFIVQKIDYKEMSPKALEAWVEYNKADGNRPDRDYPHFDKQGFIITAIKE
jgi:SAM-dependent methyltransferase